MVERIMSDSTLYCEAFIESAQDGYRWRIFQVDGVYTFEYQEYVTDEGNLNTMMTGGHWKSQSSFEGLLVDEVDRICEALRLVASHGGQDG